MAPLQIRRVGYAAGAEIRGVDLSVPLDDATVAEIRQAWLEHLILCFPDQNLTDMEQLVTFTSRFGEVDRIGAAHDRDNQNPAIILLTNKARGDKPWDGHKQGEYWHSDQSQTLHPNPGTFVLAKELPAVGGDTMFSNQYMAYESLSHTMKSLLDGLEAVHDSALRARFGYALNPAAQTNESRPRKKEPPVVHPVVTVHPETKRKTLYVDQRVPHFLGMTEEESRPLLDFLLRHAVNYEFTYRHRWRVNDLIMWDNRCLMHYALVDYDQLREPRHLWRCALRGPTRGYLFDPNDASADSKGKPRLVPAI
jgi:taurine dioxygenase